MKTDFSWSLKGNMGAYRMYLDKLINIGISAYKWENLPEGTDEVYMEKALFYNGRVVFFRDDTAGFVNLNYITKGLRTVYGYPSKLDAYSPFNNYRYPLTYKNSVVIYNNPTRTPSYQACKIYAMDLYDLHMTARVNAKAQKTPVLIVCNKKQRLTLKNLFTQFDGNSPVIYGDDELINIDGLKVLKTDAPFILDKIQAYKEKIWNEVLEMLGVPSVEQKKERFIEAEVAARNSGSNAQIGSGLLMRQQAAEKINKMFGLNVMVSPRYEGGIVDGEVHNAGEDNMRTESGTTRSGGSGRD